MSDRFALLCQSFRVGVYSDAPITVDAQFVVPVTIGCSAAEIGETLRKLGVRLMGNPINLVRSAGKPRCFYCGRVNEPGVEACAGCGASMF